MRARGAYLHDALSYSHDAELSGQFAVRAARPLRAGEIVMRMHVRDMISSAWIASAVPYVRDVASGAAAQGSAFADPGDAALAAAAWALALDRVHHTAQDRVSLLNVLHADSCDTLLTYDSRVLGALDTPTRRAARRLRRTQRAQYAALRAAATAAPTSNATLIAAITYELYELCMCHVRSRAFSIGTCVSEHAHAHAHTQAHTQTHAHAYRRRHGGFSLPPHHTAAACAPRATSTPRPRVHV